MKSESSRGKAHTRDAFGSDWKGKARGTSHKYDGVEVDKDGKALIGNKYGGVVFGYRYDCLLSNLDSLLEVSYISSPLVPTLKFIAKVA
jgi:hypothetical protein